MEIIPCNIFNHGFIAVSFSYKNKKEQKKKEQKNPCDSVTLENI